MSDQSGSLPTSAPSSGPALPPGMTISQVLGRVFSVMRQQARSFLGILAIPMGVLVVFYGLTVTAMFRLLPPFHPQNPPNPSIGEIAGIFATLSIAMFGFMAVYALFEAGASYAVLQANAGAVAGSREANTVALRHAGRYIWLAVLRSLIACMPAMAVVLIVVFLAVLAPGFSGKDPAAAMVMAPLLLSIVLCMAVYSLVVIVRLALAYPASITEDLSAWEAIRRSNRLTKGARGRIFLVMLLIGLMAYAGILLVELVLWLAVALGMVLIVTLHLNAAWGIAGAVLLGVVLAAFMLLLTVPSWVANQAAFAVFYCDQRWRLEGLMPTPISAGQ